MAHKSNEEQIEELKAEAKQAWSDAKDLAQRGRSGALSLWLSRPLPLAPRAAFFREVGKCLEAGLPLSECFAACSKEARAGDMGAVIDDLAARTSKGQKLWLAMREHGNAFERFELALTECGMRTGHGAAAFAAIAQRLQARAEIAEAAIGNPQRAPLLIAALLVMVMVPLSAKGFFGFLWAAVGTAFWLALFAALLGGGWLFLRGRRAQRHAVMRSLGKIKQVHETLQARRYADFLAAFSVAARSGLTAERAVGIAAMATDDGEIELAANAALQKLQQGGGLDDLVAALPAMDDELKAALLPSDGNLVGATAALAETQRERYVAKASKLGKVVHYALAALLVLVAITAGSGDEKKKKKRRHRAHATQRGDKLDEAGGALNKRLTGQKSADDRAKRALGER